MVAGLAAAKTSAGAPSLIWVASAELPAKLKVTLEPGLAASKSLPICVNDSVSDAAANTRISPVTPGVVACVVGVTAGVCEPPQAPTVRAAAAAKTATAVRFQPYLMCCSSSYLPQTCTDLAQPRPWST